MLTRSIIQYLVALGVVLSPIASAHAVLCKYIDQNGHVTYSDAPVKGAQKSSCFEAPPVPTPPPPPAAKPATGGAPGAVVPAPAGGLPNVDPAIQRKRDDSRRKILEDELASEEKSLAGARKALSDGEGVRLGDEKNYQRYVDRIQGLKDRVSQHERNVNALRQELSNLR
jgi:hypothetical protein